MRKPFIFMIVLFVAAATFGALTARAAAPVARFATVEGDVKTRSSAQGEWAPAKAGQTLAKGGQIRTASGAQCLVAISGDQSSALRAEGGTEASLSSLEPVRFDLRTGKLLAVVKDLKSGSRFEIATPTAIASVRGTAFSAEPNQFEAFEDSVELAPVGGGEPTVLEEGFGASFDPSGGIETFELGDEAKGYFADASSEMEQAASGGETPAADAGSSEPAGEEGEAGSDGNVLDDPVGGAGMPDMDEVSASSENLAETKDEFSDVMDDEEFLGDEDDDDGGSY